MKKLLLLGMLCFSMIVMGQNDEAYVKELTTNFTQKLVERGITDYFTINRYCSGQIEMFQIGKERKLCTSKGTYYKVFVVWKDGDAAWIKKIDNCGLFYSEQLESASLFDYYAKHKEELKLETVKPYKSASFTGTPVSRSQTQACFRKITLVDAFSSGSMSYNLFDISDDKPGDNLNYKHNQALHLVALDAQLDTVLATSEAKMRRQI